MERDLYLTEAPQSGGDSLVVDTLDTPNVIQAQPQKASLPKSLINPNDRRNQIGKKILSSFPMYAYYDDKKIRPGISVYKVILDTEERRKDGYFKGPYLHMNIRPTATFTDNSNSMIYCENKTVQTASYISYYQFVSKLYEIRNERWAGSSTRMSPSGYGSSSLSSNLGFNHSQGHNPYSNHNSINNPANSIFPSVLNKSCNGIVYYNSIIMNNYVTAAKILPRSENVITTKFVQPFGMFPNIVRLFYTPKHVKTAKQNLAYKVINRKQMTYYLFKRKYRLASQFLVNVYNYDSYIATLIKGKALANCYTMASSLVEYLEHSLLISINYIVIDFIVDQNRTMWFNEICSVKSQNKTKIWEIGNDEQISKMAHENNNQIMCRLCGMLYTKQYMEKLVTNKLIYELSTHLYNRGKQIKDVPHVKKYGLSNVCHLCYELIKAEHTLINVEREFSYLMNIRQNSIERVQSKETAKQTQLYFYDEEYFQALGERTSNYKKWRLFLYIYKLKRFPDDMQIDEQYDVEVELEMRFQNQKEKFVRVVYGVGMGTGFDSIRGMSRNSNLSNKPRLWSASSSQRASTMELGSSRKVATQGTKIAGIRARSAVGANRRSQIQSFSSNHSRKMSNNISNSVEKSSTQLHPQLKQQQAYHNNDNIQDIHYFQIPHIQSGNINHIKNNDKSYQDQTTCVTHSYSYFEAAATPNNTTVNGNSNDTTLDLINLTGPNVTVNSNINNNTNNYVNLFSLSYYSPQYEDYLKDEDGNKEEKEGGKGDYQNCELKEYSTLPFVNQEHIQSGNFSNKPQPVSTHPISNSQSNQHCLNSVKMDKVKMFIFYTKAHEHYGKNFLEEEYLYFNLKIGSYKYQGKSSTLKNLKNKTGCQRHSSEVYLFDEGLKYCNLELTVGMIGDGIFYDEGLDLYKRNNLFWGKTYSCLPLPDEWMYVFTNGEEVPKANPEKILEQLYINNFSTSQSRCIYKVTSVNYIKSFEYSLSRPLSGINSLSSSNLKKTSFARCKTAASQRPTTSNFFKKIKRTNNYKIITDHQKENEDYYMCFDI